MRVPQQIPVPLGGGFPAAQSQSGGGGGGGGSPLEPPLDVVVPYVMSGTEEHPATRKTSRSAIAALTAETLPQNEPLRPNIAPPRTMRGPMSMRAALPCAGCVGSGGGLFLMNTVYTPKPVAIAPTAARPMPSGR